MAHYHHNNLAQIEVPRVYAWVVFAFTFGLLISDYMSRQVLNAVFPLLKAEWSITDAQLGSLSGIVALMVALLTVPLSLLADRWGRVKSLTLMALLWSVATVLCGLSESYGQMFGARFLVGVGEAAYGSVGVALALSVFPSSMRATISASFMAGGMFGSVLGIALGGIVAAAFGWRWAFAFMGMFGLVLALVFPLVVRQDKLGARQQASTTHLSRPSLLGLVNNRSVICAYVGSGLQLFVAAALMSWIPSFMNRYYGMATDKAGMVAGVFVLIGGVGMVVCGMLSDRLCRNRPERKIALAIGICLVCFLLLSVGFRLPAGQAQMLLLALGMFLVAGTSGPAGAMVANLTHPAISGTAFATLTLVNNILGMAPGPFFTGVLADRLGLDQALALVPLMGLASAAAFLYARRHYLGDQIRAHSYLGKESITPQ
ncbi:MAG TPA: MFS transporter [Xanthomonadales bacterium]|nr:MFS transporter [Xanthomonadales bacterium]